MKPESAAATQVRTYTTVEDGDDQRSSSWLMGISALHAGKALSKNLKNIQKGRTLGVQRQEITDKFLFFFHFKVTFKTEFVFLLQAAVP